MEITVSKKGMMKVVILLLVAAVLFGLYLGWSEEIIRAWFTNTQPVETSFAEEPAMRSLAAMYSPRGERSNWEEQVCAGMTEPGCEMFRAMYADPLWNSIEGQNASVSFIEITETLEDGSQIWKTEVTSGEETLPVYIHVVQNEAGQWLLQRVLFSQEAAQYEEQ